VQKLAVHFITLLLNMHVRTQIMQCASHCLLCSNAVLRMQAAQVRKSNYVPEKGRDYDPDKNHTCTVYAGTVVQQVMKMNAERGKRTC